MDYYHEYELSPCTLESGFHIWWEKAFAMDFSVSLVELGHHQSKGRSHEWPATSGTLADWLGLKAPAPVSRPPSALSTTRQDLLHRPRGRRSLEQEQPPSAVTHWLGWSMAGLSSHPLLIDNKPCTRSFNVNNEHSKSAVNMAPVPIYHDQPP